MKKLELLSKDKKNISIFTLKLCDMNIRSSILSVLFVSFSILMIGQELTTTQAPLPCLNKKFTIVAHIVKDTFGVALYNESDITLRLNKVNEVFSPICASFEVCEFRYIDNFQYHQFQGQEWEEAQIKYNQHNRINMYFGPKTNNSPFRCGMATPSGIIEMESGGIAIECDTWVAIAHELGHYFGLLHTFQDSGVELVDGSNCETEGDEICDTPADPYVEGELLMDYLDKFEICRFNSPKVDANGQYYEPDVGNIMSYYGCACGFTYQQFQRMANTYLSAPFMW